MNHEALKAKAVELLGANQGKYAYVSNDESRLFGLSQHCIENANVASSATKFFLTMGTGVPGLPQDLDAVYIDQACWGEVLTIDRSKIIWVSME